MMFKLKNIFKKEEDVSKKLLKQLRNNKLSKIIKLLVEHPSLINITYPEFDNTSALHIAVSIGNTEVVKLFIERGANINAEKIDKTTPLICSVIDEHLEVTKMLVDSGADLDKRSYKLEGKNYLGVAAGTALHWAASKNRLDIMEVLIRAGASIDSNCHDGKTPLQWALWYHKMDAAMLLVNKGAFVDNEDNDGKRPLHNLLYAVRNKFTRDYTKDLRNEYMIAKLLISKGADINSVDNILFTPLMYACARPIINVELVKLFIKSGAIRNLKDKSGKTALEFAEGMLQQFDTFLPDNYKDNLREVIFLLN